MLRRATMFLILQNQRPAARLSCDRAGKWELQYLGTASQPILPTLPIRTEPFLFGRCPQFLRSLLPAGPRRVLAAAKIHATSEDDVAFTEQLLGSESVGELTVVPMLQLGQMPPLLTPRATIYLPDLARLGDPAELSQVKVILAAMSGTAAIGGKWPKVHLKTETDAYIVKQYPDFDIPGKTIATLERASLLALSRVGNPAVVPLQFDDLLVSQRFDMRSCPTAAVCHAVDLVPDPEQQMSLEDTLKLLRLFLPGNETKKALKNAVFAWVIGDTDHTLENIILLGHGEPRKWEIAPSIDATPARLFSNDAAHTALSVNGKRTNLSISDFAQAAKIVGLSLEELRQFTAAAVVEAKEILLPVLSSSYQEKFKRHLAMMNLIIQAATVRQTTLAH